MVEIVWEFEVHPEHVSTFEKHYGPQGTWAGLFRRSPEYGGTVLLRDTARSGRYVTIDRWPDSLAFDKFNEKFAEEYRQIDEQMEQLTVSERRVGVFEVVESANMYP